MNQKIANNTYVEFTLYNIYTLIRKKILIEKL